MKTRNTSKPRRRHPAPGKQQCRGPQSTTRACEAHEHDGEAREGLAMASAVEHTTLAAAPGCADDGDSSRASRAGSLARDRGTWNEQDQPETSTLALARKIEKIQLRRAGAGVRHQEKGLGRCFRLCTRTGTQRMRRRVQGGDQTRTGRPGPLGCAVPMLESIVKNRNAGRAAANVCISRFHTRAREAAAPTRRRSEAKQHVESLHQSSSQEWARGAEA